MALTLYNSLTRRKELFQPLDPAGQQVKLYCCGVTVYDYCHLGHARSYIVWDTLRRYLLWSGYQVRYVQNFTDIDDKILNRAKAEGSTMEAVSEQYIQAYFEDMARLNVMEADEYPRATHTLDGIKRLIHELEQKEYAYATGGDVYYRVEKFAGYGKLSGRKLEDMQAGASGRVTADAEAAKKENSFDFALWKGAKPGEPAWESPWGSGRPGWHIECSAMVRDRLGDSIDIHMGGADLTFPHHENEIAQSEAATGHPLARYWLHNGMVNVGGEKMSKSLGNFTTIRDLLDKGGVNPQVLRLFVLQAQYRKPLDFTDEAIESAQNGWQTLTEGLRFGAEWGDRLGWSGRDSVEIDRNSDPIQRFQAALNDDLNTPAALAVLFELAKDLRKVSNCLTHGQAVEADRSQLQTQWQTLVTLAGVLGLEAGEGETGSVADTAAICPSDAEIEALIEARQEARKTKNWAEADRIRDELQSQGITLIDKAEGTHWHRSE
ncbi:MAG: cysteine--tRNA ligase [Prochlorothrix sp.]